jgi:prepilin-type N-terminal cleavage/methylation domain-containing protein
MRRRARLRRPGGARGFTLIELLITMSVTTIGLIGLLSLHLSIARGNDGASRSAEAQQVGVSEIESLRALSLVNMMQRLTSSTALVFPTAPRVLTVVGRGNTTFTVTTQVTQLNASSPSLLKLRTTVQWTEDGGTTGANAQLDHQLALEIIRTMEEVL